MQESPYPLCEIKKWVAARAMNLKLTSLICAASLHGASCLAPAAKAIEIDPNPGDGKCYYIDNELTVDYNKGNEYAGILNSNPWVGRDDSQEIAERTAQLFNSETGQNWRFAWKATGGNTNNKNDNKDSLNTWYYVRQNAGQPKNQDGKKGFYTTNEDVWTNFAQGYEYACFDDTPGEDVVEELLPELPDEIADLLIDGDGTARFTGLRGANRRTIGRLISGLVLPRNINASGGLATQAYINDLADTVLERLPTRQFQKVQVTEEITEVEIQEPTSEPVRGLWKTSDSGKLDVDVATIEIEGDIYAENPNLTSIYTEPYGTRVWARGFGGSMSPYETGGTYGKRGLVYYPDVYNNFYSSHGGLVVGVDTSLFDNIQLGIFGNYGDINLTHFSSRYTGGGSWNPSGFGGGVMASYWADNFYVQGAFGATAFSGENKRQAKLGNIINETYTATKDTTSYMGTLRVGAPFTWGSLILEPQATAIWNGNDDASYTESGRYRALALKVKSYSDNFLRTTLGAKLAWPIKQGDRNLFVPNLKVAWLADWDTNNGAVKFQRANAKKPRTAEIPSTQDTQNGVLVEGGLDYAIAQGPTTAWKFYAKGGAKLWVNKAADWRTSGGVTFQF